ncbi:hypothetical protein COX86_01335 [Candidatus Micrarchaeota archaeon CG_4_10_14_0_2_um_filter_60_11]|nr:MAG: hypothetical protein AUJ16_01405 [Candidatus Micrarchaeota archaeon CG1_02_60_51]PIN96338.1 MAG: hypothetical protein COU39_01570 [Candidatus Micrarchaeota archaeon CG10_big_fil_rev_8_21_14_0_10_60_32]PIO01725.1 MAG: hypothetical protein COT58_03585 [Candidatus Micrarchaeota archaeon CG09_land_8_20_14_0_10_60_16]PIY91254.1 MAG: hypothetical protein COY71_04110 [Candidatus Micrarchaeota archaeon CG_4_10_14_0_8_um_filter_60_7]PIZ91105.1 MAG: hypothetical protein COX86_01335 [Candidatus Mi
MAKEAVCCPPFDPKKWDGKVLVWKDKRFVRARVLALFHIPVNFGGVMTRLMAKIEAVKAKTPDAMCLAEGESLWGMDVYVGVNRNVPGVENAVLSGKYLCKVFEGSFSDAGKWMKDFAAFAERKGFKPGRTFMWYTTCPKCAKKYGKNYVAVLAKVG